MYFCPSFLSYFVFLKGKIQKSAKTTFYTEGPIFELKTALRDINQKHGKLKTTRYICTRPFDFLDIENP